MFTRRTFIKSSAFASLGVLAWPYSSLIKSKLGVALVGLGYYSTQVLAPALQETEHCELRGIVTGSPWKIPKWQRQYGIPDRNVYNYETMHEVADNSDIDVIYIVLPTGLHSKYSIIAAEAGKHVWCEKPMARTVGECQAVIEACNKNKVKLAIGYRMQHEPNTREIIELASTKPFGAITTVTAEAGYYDSRTDHWKQDKELGGGAMYDMGVYPVNAARYVTQKEPIAITAAHRTTRPKVYHEVDETTEFTLEFPDGIIMNGKTSLGESYNRLHVACENGWYGLEPFQSYNGISGRASDGRKFNARIPNQQARQMDDDALSILNNTPMMVPGEDGLRDIRVVEAAYRSAATGERVTL